ncbi:MAG TPA: M1 family aminopeptidase [Blastocatellia bacterium]|nr:M1 family aminopeptidase [Blastocatellia bacterium]
MKRRAFAVTLIALLSAVTFQPVAGVEREPGIVEVAETPRPAPSLDEKNPRANSEPTYVALRNAKLSGIWAGVENVVLKRDNAIITLKSGQIYFLSPVEGRITGAVFLGDGAFELAPLGPLEKKNLSIFTGTGSISEQFTKLVLRFTDSTFEEIKKQATLTENGSIAAAQSALDDQRNLLRKGRIVASFSTALYLLRYNMDARIMMDVLSPGQQGFFHAFFSGKRFGDTIYSIDPLGQPFVAPEEVVLANLTESSNGMWVASHVADHYRTAAFVEEDHLLIDLQDYKIDATVKGKRLDATVDCKFSANRDSTRVLPFNLFPRLRVSKVTDAAARELNFVQEDKNEDGDLFVVLAEPLKRGQQYTLTFKYGGDDAVSDSGGGNYTLDARDNWYPNAVNTFNDRATYEMTLRTPKNLIMVATGQPQGETVEGDQSVSRWKSDIPLAVAGFNYGKFKKTAVVEEKLKYNIESYANKEIPDYLKELQHDIEAAETAGFQTDTTLGSLNTVKMMDKARAEAQLAVGLYSQVFGPLPYGRVAMTQQPYFSFGQAWPMLVYMPLSAYLDNTHKHQLGMDASNSFFKIVGPHEVAHQWWGHVIGWKSYRDQWMSEGFAHFSGALFAQMVYKNDLFLKFWKEQRELITRKNEKGRRPADVGSVYMGYRLNTPKTGSVAQAMIYPKGGFILHMIRMLMWDPKTKDDRFVETMKDFVKTHYNANVSTQDFQRAVERHMTPEMDLDGNGKMDWFFNQWVYGSSIPDYKFEYRFDAGEGGKVKLIGKVTQSNVDDNFKMRVPLYLDFDGRVSRIGVVTMIGNSSTDEFQVPLPTRPKKAMLAYYEDVLCTTNER